MWAQGARLTPLSQSHILTFGAKSALSGMCGDFIDISYRKVLPLTDVLLVSKVQLFPSISFTQTCPLINLMSQAFGIKATQMELTKVALCVDASHCLFHVVIDGVNGFGLILKRLWHQSEHSPSFPGGYGCSTCPVLSLCHTHHWPFSPSCTNCTKSPSSRVRESGKQLSKLPSTRKRLLP